MDKIDLQGLQFYGRHGVLREENSLGQRFKVDLSLFLDLQSAGSSDNLELTVNYAEVYQLCREIMEGEPCRLIETAAEKIAQAVLQKFPLIKKIRVRIEKPQAPIAGIFDCMAVEIERSAKLLEEKGDFCDY